MGASVPSPVSATAVAPIAGRERHSDARSDTQNTDTQGAPFSILPAFCRPGQMRPRVASASTRRSDPLTCAPSSSESRRQPSRSTATKSPGSHQPTTGRVCSSSSASATTTILSPPRTSPDGCGGCASSTARSPRPTSTRRFSWSASSPPCRHPQEPAAVVVRSRAPRRRRTTRRRIRRRTARARRHRRGRPVGEHMQVSLVNDGPVKSCWRMTPGHEKAERAATARCPLGALARCSVGELCSVVPGPKREDPWTVPVTATVCSQCAARLPSVVTTVQSSPSTRSRTCRA